MIYRLLLLIAVLVLVLAAVLLGARVRQSVGLSAPCSPNNHQINDPRLLSSTFLNVDQTGVLEPSAVFQHRNLYVSARTSVVKLDEAGRPVATFQMPGQVSGIALDRAGDLYATGSTTSSGGWSGEVYRRYGKGDIGGAFIVKESPDGRILWRTDLGGDTSDEGTVIAVSNSGDIWAGGRTISDRFPLLRPFERHYHGPSMSHLPPQGAAFPDDSWVAKLDSDGRLAFSSYLGGSQNDELTALAIDRARQPVLFGWTASPDFTFMRRILAPPRSRLGVSTSITFVVRLTLRGRLISSTPVIHGASILGTGMTLDHSGAIYLVDNDQVIKLDPTASRIVYRTGLGRYVGATSITVGAAGRVYVTGGLMTPTLHTVLPLQAHFHPHTCGIEDSIHSCSDAFISMLNRHEQLRLASYLGGTWDDSGEAIVAGDGKIFVVGTTDSPNFPLRHASACTIEGPVIVSGDKGPTTGFVTVIKQ